MVDRIVEVSERAAHLSIRDRQLVLRTDESMEVTVPVDDLAAVVLAHPRATISHAALAALAEAGAILVASDARYHPAAMLLPLEGNYVQTERFLKQAEAGLPLRKRLWQQVVRAKIRAQAATLRSRGGPEALLLGLVRAVRSGDASNVEAQAARRYWPALMGDAFRRDPGREDANRLLNYGYAILRAATARAIVAAGLHPTLGLHHRDRFNPFCLADDLMEPFRPSVDLVVASIVDERGASVALDRDLKTTLIAAILARRDVEGESRTTFDILARIAQSLAAVFVGSSRRLWLPDG